MNYSSIEADFKWCIPESDGAQLVVYSNGEKVIDVATGIDSDSLTGIFSVSKALTALSVAKLVDQGRVNLHEKVASYWTEFAQSGKENITVLQLLTHQAGLPETRIGLTAQQWHSHHEAASLLAESEPFWKPGSGFGYHAVTIGILINELFHRITGVSVQEFYEREIRKPIEADAYLGLPENLHSRFMAPLQPPTPLPDLDKDSLAEHVWGRFVSETKKSNGVEELLFTKERLEFGAPAVGGVTSARGLAKVFNWATNYGHDNSGISRETLHLFGATHVKGLDIVQNIQDRHHGIIFMKPTLSCPFGSNNAFGHDGAGGAIVFADPDKKLVFAYTVRRLTYPGGLDQRILPIIQKLIK